MSNFIRANVEYQLTRRIAEGGMGAVYEAVQYGSEGFQKQVAVKTIIHELTDNQDFVDMFIGEAKLVADLVHENIVQVYHLGHSGDAFYIIMEYIDGVDLMSFMARHKEKKAEIPVELCAFIISRVCRGLDNAHRKVGRDGRLLGVVHRDVSPRNIMITRLGVVKLGDFGIAKARKLLESREGDILMGKSQYMSPEQADYQETTPASDLFSLGIVFYQLLTGVSVFEDEDTLVTLRNVSRAKVPPVRKLNPNVPADLEEILMTALKRKPEDRFVSAGEMGYALEHYMYHDRFGPTNVTLENYLSEIFPEKALPPPLSLGTTKRSATLAVEIGKEGTLLVEETPFKGSKKS